MYSIGYITQGGQIGLATTDSGQIGWGDLLEDLQKSKKNQLSGRQTRFDWILDRLDTLLDEDSSTGSPA